MKYSSPDAYRLLHEGAIAFAEMERTGMPIDTDYIRRETKKTNRRIRILEDKLQRDPVWKTWKRVYGEKAKLGNRQQLGEVVFGELGFKRPRVIGKKGKNDVSAFRNVDIPFVKRYFKMAKLQKAKSTYLTGVLKHVVNNRLHPSNNLNIATTYRSSVDNPNTQNWPIRDPAIAKLVRQMFVPGDDDYVIVEIDFSGIEVRGAACYNHDPVLISYLKDKSKDMHRDMAMECYMLTQDQVTKDARYCAKNQFVFPEFYGSYYKQCAPALWESIEKMNLARNDGVGLAEHLADKGITRLGKCDPEQKHPRPGTFERHIMQVQERFWNDRFKVYKKWKETWYEQYQKRGWFETLTGFVIHGHWKRNEVLNFPIQGVAFHFLLQSLIYLTKEIKERRWKSRLAQQIHDSLIALVHRKELDKFLFLSHKVMTEMLPELWKWICVPLEVEVGVSEKNWYEKVEYRPIKGEWKPA